MGSTGDSSGSHLHFEVHKYKWTADKKNAVDPMLALENVRQGESVQAMKKVERNNGQVMAAATEFSSEEKLEKPEEKPVENNENSDGERQQTGHELAHGVKVDKIIHFVRPGENLTVIAGQYDSSVEHIQETNNLQSDKIYPGQKLVIEPEDLYEYTVRPGDNLSSIAKKTGVTIEHLMSENGLRSSLIRPGQKLFYRHPRE